MDQYTFIKLSEKIKNGSIQDAQDFGFESSDYSKGYTSAYFLIHWVGNSHFNIIIDENRTVILTKDDEVRMTLSETDSKKWLQMADDTFKEKYSEDIEKAEKDNAYNSYREYQDAMSEMYRYGW